MHRESQKSEKSLPGVYCSFFILRSVWCILFSSLFDVLKMFFMPFILPSIRLSVLRSIGVFFRKGKNKPAMRKLIKFTGNHVDSERMQGLRVVRCYISACFLFVCIFAFPAFAIGFLYFGQNIKEKVM